MRKLLTKVDTARKKDKWMGKKYDKEEILFVRRE